MDYELVLHIGANKTGSSAIQNFLCMNASKLRSAGFLVPDHKLEWSQLITGEQVFELQKLMDAGSAELVLKFRQLMDNRPSNGVVLISAENLSNERYYLLFRQVCASYKTKIVLYIRRQDDLLMSTWQQWYSKEQVDLQAWLTKVIGSIGNWKSIVDGWEEVCGAGTVDLRLFERETLPNGNIVADFTDAIGIERDSVEVNFQTVDINPSYADFIVPLVSGNRGIFRNTHDNRFYSIIAELTAEAYSGGTKYSLISRAQRDAINARYAAGNEELRSRFFPEKETLFRSVDHSKYIYLNETQLIEHQVRFLTQILFELALKCGLSR